MICSNPDCERKGQDLPLTAFGFMGDGRGYRSKCNVCLSLYRKAYYAQNKNKEHIKAKSHPRYCKKAMDCMKRKKQGIKNHVADKTLQKLMDTLPVLTNYKFRTDNVAGLNLQRFEEMYDSQQGKCMICGYPNHFSKGFKHQLNLAIDHCHETLKVRDLLCTTCNTAVGKFQESIIYVLAALIYLIDHDPNFVCAELEARLRDRYSHALSVLPKPTRTLKGKSAIPQVPKESTLRKYNLTLAQWHEMNTKQKGLCAICETRARLFVDHNHNTGAVRKLLCTGCNTGIGMLDENVFNMITTIAYIQKHRGDQKAFNNGIILEIAS